MSRSSTENRIDWVESVLGVVYVAGSLAADRIADVVPRFAQWSLMDTVIIGGVEVMWGTLLSLAALFAAWAIQDSGGNSIDGWARKVIWGYVFSTAVMILVPAVGSWIHSSLAAGVAHFGWGVAAYYYITYA